MLRSAFAGVAALIVDDARGCPRHLRMRPEAVAGTWPGCPGDAVATGDAVDWCPAVTTKASADAVQTFGDDQVEAAACAAVGFVLDHRYSRLSLPRTTYRPSDFDGVISALSDAPAET